MDGYMDGQMDFLIWQLQIPENLLCSVSVQKEAKKDLPIVPKKLGECSALLGEYEHLEVLFIWWQMNACHCSTCGVQPKTSFVYKRLLLSLTSYNLGPLYNQEGSLENGLQSPPCLARIQIVLSHNSPAEAL
jgi:hypothetical protein